MSDRAEATIVIPTKNSIRTIERCLASVREQTVACELIVVDNSSSDGTTDTARRLADVVLNKGPERSAQRNAGLRCATADTVAFIDSDMELEPEVIAEALGALEGGAAGVTVPEYTDGYGFWVSVRRLERSYYDGDQKIEAARVFRRELIGAMGGFDESMPPGPEDWDLTIRVRQHGSLARTTARIRHDEGSIGYLEACRKKAYYAPGLKAFHDKYGRRQLASVLDRPYFRRPWRLLTPDPALGLGVLALKAGEAVAVGAALARSH